MTSGKFTRPARELILAFLQFVPSGREGEIEIIDGNGGDGSWLTTRPPPVQVGGVHDVIVKFCTCCLLVGRI